MKQIFFAFLISCLALPVSVTANQQEKVNYEFETGNKRLRCGRYKEGREDVEHNISNTSDNEGKVTCNKQSKKKGQLKIGYSAKAILGTGISWSGLNSNSTENDRKYIFRLDKGWKNSFGEDISTEMLPEGLRAIAQVTRRSTSGLFVMEVIEIINGDIKMPVPPGVIEISAKDGSPLKAELRQKEDSRFAEDFGIVVGAGVQETVNRSTVNRGVARGANDVINRRLRASSSNSGLISSYFEFESGQEVLLTVYDNFSI